MPSPEHGPGGPEHPRPAEPDPAPYLRVAAFADDRTAGRVYARVQDTIFATPCDLSAYRFLLDQVSHVAVLGAPPPPDLDDALAQLLATGTSATLPSAVHQALTARRQQMGRRGPWSEGHYRPGRRL
jgi:hypothetical protein